MNRKISFYGASGAGRVFEQVASSDKWARRAGIAVFAAPDAFGWRVIRVVELTGQDHDVRPVWALHEAERYGANSVFISDCDSRADRRDLIADLEMGLSPVLGGRSTGLALAA